MTFADVADFLIRLLKRAEWLFERPVPVAPILIVKGSASMAIVSFIAVPVDPAAITVEGTFTFTPTGAPANAPVVVSGPIANPCALDLTGPGEMSATQVQINALGERTLPSSPGTIAVPAPDAFPTLTPAAPILTVQSTT